MNGSLDKTRVIFRSGARQLMAKVNTWTGGRVTPAMITVIGVGMHLPIAYFIANDQLLLAGGLAIVFGLFDILDGELSRLQKSASPYGMVLDATTDRIKEVLLYAAIAYWFTANGQAEWAFLAVLAAGLATTVTYAKAKGEVAMAVQNKLFDHHKLNRYFSEKLVAYDTRIAIVIAGLLFNQLLAATALVAVLATIMCFVILADIKRALKKSKNSD